MLRYIVRRFVGAVFTVWAACTITFVLYRLLPHHTGLSISFYRSAAANGRLDSESALPQYLTLLGHWLRGDFGFYEATNRPLMALELSAARITLVLLAETVLVAAVVSVPLGLLLAARHHRVSDRVLSLVSLVAASSPLMLVGLLLVQLLSYEWKLLPPVGPAGTSSLHLLADVPAMVLPVITLAIPLIGRFVLVIRSAAVGQFGLDYIRTARAKGAGTLRVVQRHLLHNVMITMLTYAAATVPITLSGVIIVEGIFNLDGLGFTLQYAAGVNTNGGLPRPPIPGLLLSTIVFTAAATAIVMFVLDVLIVAVDPRLTR